MMANENRRKDSIAVANELKYTEEKENRLGKVTQWQCRVGKNSNG